MVLQVASSVEDINNHCMAFCKEFKVEVLQSAKARVRIQSVPYYKTVVAWLPLSLEQAVLSWMQFLSWSVPFDSCTPKRILAKQLWGFCPI